MYNRRKSKDNFESKFIEKINCLIKIIYLDLIYHNNNSHPSHINSNGKTSLGKFIYENIPENKIFFSSTFKTKW